MTALDAGVGTVLKSLQRFRFHFFHTDSFCCGIGFFTVELLFLLLLLLNLLLLLLSNLKKYINIYIVLTKEWSAVKLAGSLLLRQRWSWRKEQSATQGEERAG